MPRPRDECCADWMFCNPVRSLEFWLIFITKLPGQFARIGACHGVHSALARTWLSDAGQLTKMTDADGCQSVGQLDVAGGVGVAAAVVVINFFILTGPCCWR